MGFGFAAVILWLAAAAAAPEQRGPASEERRPVLWQGAAEEPAEGMRERLLADLARIELSLAVERDHETAGVALETLWLRAAREVPYEGRFEVLARIAEARARRALELGEVELARRALDGLLPDAATVRARGAGAAFADASSELLERERAALASPRLEELRRELAARGAVLDGLEESGLAAEIAGDPLLLRVHRALEEGDAQLLETLGFSAAPALARLSELSLDRLIGERGRDPFFALVKVADLRAAELALATLDRGGSFWRKRILRAMREGEVLSSDAAWHASGGVTVCRKPQWIAVLERLAVDREHARESLSIIAQVLEMDFLTPRLAAALAMALESGDADLVQAALHALEQADGALVKPALVEVLNHADRAVRLFAAAKLATTRRPGAFLDAVEHPDPAVRRELASWASRFAPTLDPEELAVLERLAVDDLADTRLIAASALMRMLPRRTAPDETYRRLAADPDPRIRAAVAQHWWHPDRALSREVMVTLAGDSSEQVLTHVDRRLGETNLDTQSRLAALSLRLRAAEEGGAAMGEQALSKAASVAATDPEGRRALARWIAASGPRELVVSLAYRLSNYIAAAADLDELEPRELARLVLALDALPSALPQYEKESANALEAIEARLDAPEAMLLILATPEASLRARLVATASLGRRGAPELERELSRLLRDDRWAGLPLGGRTRRDLGTAVASLDGARRNALLLAVASDPLAADLPAESLARHFEEDAPGAEELALAVLERWFADEGEARPAVHRALEALGRFPQRIDPELLVRAARHAGYAESAVELMGRLKDPQYLGVLGECIEAGWLTGRARGAVQRKAVWALTQYLSDGAAEVLLAGVAMSVTDAIRDACFDAVHKIARYQEEKAKLAARALSEKRHEQVVARVAALLADPDAATRAEAARAAATLCATELLPELILLLRDADEGVRIAARQALDRLNAPDDSR